MYTMEVQWACLWPPEQPGIRILVYPLRAAALQEFTLVWLVKLNGFTLEAAAATLNGMAGRLTALKMPPASVHHFAAVQQAGPALAGALSSLSFDISTSHPQNDLRAAAEAVRGLAAGLQHVELGLDTMSTWAPDTATIREVDAAFRELMRSLPSCQRLRLGSCHAISRRAMREEVLRHAPDLLSLRTQHGEVHEQVKAASAIWINHKEQSYYCLHKPVQSRFSDCQELGLGS